VCNEQRPAIAPVPLSTKGNAMRKVTLAGFALALVFAVSGCGDSPDSVIKDQIKLMNDMADVLEGIKDKDSAEKAKPKLEALAKKAKDIEERAKKLKLDDMPKEKQEALKKKYEDDIKKAAGRFGAAMMKAMTNPDAAGALKGIDLKGFGK
jgi:hypothetical protein